MLMRHMHMGISMDIALRVNFIAHSPFLRKLQKAYHAPPFLSTPSIVLMMYFTQSTPIFSILSATGFVNFSVPLANRGGKGYNVAV